MPVLDASALAAICLPRDPHHGQVVRWLRANVGSLRAPAIALAEVAAALGRTSRLRPEAVQAAISDMLVEPGLVREPVTSERAAHAARLAVELGLRGCDAVYVALAQELDELLVTFDAEQLARGAEAIRVLSPS